MPAPGDQHKIVANPFAEPAQHMSEYTAQEVATLQSRLEKQLGPEYLSARSGPSGQKVHYIAAEKIISLANEIFGFNGWSSSIQNIQVDFVDEHPQTLKISIGLSVIVRVTLRNGTYHEDIGYGHIENCKGKAAAFEKAKKEGTTDGLKRALRSFGNVLGNCIYDKDYVNKVSKMKVVPNARKFDAQYLHRHADYAIKTEPIAAAPARTLPTPGPAVTAAAKSESSSDSLAFGIDAFDEEDLLGDFDEADFCVAEDGHPDEVVIPALAPPQSNQGSRNTSPVRQFNGPTNGPTSRTVNNGVPPRPPQTPGPINGRPNHSGPGPRPYQPGHNNNNSNSNNTNQFNRPHIPPPASNGGQRPNFNHGTNNHGNGNSNANASKPAGHGDDEGTPWLSARAVAKVGDGDALPAVQPNHLFNPKAESPSIRKTPGFDHTMSKPIPRQSQRVATANPTATGPGVAQAGAVQSSSHAGNNAASHTTAGVSSNANAGATPISHPPPRTMSPMPDPQSARRIGAPPSTASPLANRGQFRPPPMKRGPPTDVHAGGNRPPLADVSSNVPVNGGSTAVATATAAGNGAAGADIKRQKLA